MRRETTNEKKNILKKQKHGYLISIGVAKAFEGIDVNRTLSSLHQGLFKLRFQSVSVSSKELHFYFPSLQTKVNCT